MSLGEAQIADLSGTDIFIVASSEGNVEARKYQDAASLRAQDRRGKRKQTSIVGAVVAKGKLAVEVDVIAGPLALSSNLPSNFIRKEFCK
jgi:hypothetical protein